VSKCQICTQNHKDIVWKLCGMQNLSSHRGPAEDSMLQGCYTPSLDKKSPKLWGIVLQSWTTWPWKWRHYNPSTQWKLLTLQHSVMSHETWNFKLCVPRKWNELKIMIKMLKVNTVTKWVQTVIIQGPAEIPDNFAKQLWVELLAWGICPRALF
jgi:hypothetical protein